jgi:site-specific DNA recombinase
MSDRIAAIYVRVSTEEQAREGQSISSQIDRLSAYAKFQGWQNVQVFCDEGFSAKDMDRPAMQRLIGLIQERRVLVVATMAVDRLSRDLLDMLQFVELCEKHGTAYVCAALNFDTGTPIGRMVLQILAAFAEFERSMIATRVKASMTDIAKKKKRYMAVPPFGYTFDDDKELVIVPEEAEWIRRAADRFITGYGYRDVARWLNDRGILTRKGYTWESSSVRQMLTNELYIGRLIWNRRYYDKEGKMHWREPDEWIVHDDAHPSILSEEQWKEIQARVTRRMPRGGSVQLKYRLSGLLRCGECGSGMVSRRYGNKGPHRTRFIFVCNGYQKKAICRFHYVFVDDADQQVCEALERFAGGNITIPLADLERAAHAAEEEHRRRMAALDSRMQRQIQAYENGLIGERDLRIARERLDHERTILLQAQEQVESPTENDVRAAVLRESRSLLWLWNHGELCVIQDALRRLIDHIVVRGGRVAELCISDALYALD